MFIKHLGIIQTWERTLLEIQIWVFRAKYWSYENLQHSYNGRMVEENVYVCMVGVVDKKWNLHFMQQEVNDW